MNVSITMDVRNVTSLMTALQREQVPFALANAINETAKQAQEVQRRHTRAVFVIRRPLFADRATKIKPFARKGSPTAVIRIEPPGGRSDILSKFETGGVKKARGGRLAIPDEARRGKAGVVTRSARPKAFGFRPHGSGPSAEVLVGDSRTFMVRRPDGTGGIYQRTGRRGRNSRRLASSISTRNVRDMMVRTLYRFTREARIDSRLKLEENVRGVVRASFASHFQEALRRAVATGRSQVVRTMEGTTTEIATRAAQRIARTDVHR